jgi:hypothetical protein
MSLKNRKWRVIDKRPLFGLLEEIIFYGQPLDYGYCCAGYLFLNVSDDENDEQNFQVYRQTAAGWRACRLLPTDEMMLDDLTALAEELTAGIEPEEDAETLDPERLEPAGDCEGYVPIDREAEHG